MLYEARNGKEAELWGDGADNIFVGRDLCSGFLRAKEVRRCGMSCVPFGASMNRTCRIM